MEKHWFTLHPDAFLWIKGDIGLVYQAENKAGLRFSLSDRIEDICRQLLMTENLYTVGLTDEDLYDPEMSHWMNSLINIHAGRLFRNIDFEKRPVSLMPILKVQDKKERYVWQHHHEVGGEILQNLHELSLYLNGSEYGNNEYFRQILFPLKDCQVSDKSKVESFFRNSINPFLSNINIVGNVFSYPDFGELINYISQFSIQCTIYMMVQDFLENMQRLKESNWRYYVQMNILIEPAFDIRLLQQVVDNSVSLTALVFSEDDYIQYTSQLEVISTIRNFKIIPLYNKQNLVFFETKVYMDIKELEAIDLSKSDIFMRQALNTLDFGRLTIMPDGYVYANVNMPCLGTINDSPYSIVYKEFMEGDSWFNIRDQKPCKDCIYQWLCPSPSNYENAIGRFNLCHIKN